MLSSFDQHGYALYSDVFDPASLAAVKAALYWNLEQETQYGGARNFLGLLEKAEAQDHQSVYQSCVSVGSSFAAMQLIGRSRLRDIAAEITGSPAAALHILPMHVQVQFPGDDTYLYDYHQESSFYPQYEKILNVWCPFEAPSREKGGTIGIVPGSHKRGRRPEEKIRGRNGFLQIVPEMTVEEARSCIPIEAEPGDALFFHADTIHRSYANCSTIPRLNLIFRIVDMGKQHGLKTLYKAPSYAG